MSFQNSDRSTCAHGGIQLIVLGVAVLVAQAVWPAVPVVTPMTIVALGATEIMRARFAGAPAFLPVMVLHAVAYCGLYALFIGARLCPAGGATPSQLSWPAALDLALSILPAGIAAQRISACLLGAILPRS